MPCHPDPVPCSAGEGSQGIYFIKVFFQRMPCYPDPAPCSAGEGSQGIFFVKVFFNACLVILILPLALPVKDLKAYFFNCIRIVIRRLLLSLR